MPLLNHVSATSLIMVCSLRVHREQQESLAHADREDRRLVLLSRPLLIYRWPSWHLSENGGSASACLRGTHADSVVKHFQVAKYLLRTLLL